MTTPAAYSQPLDTSGERIDLKSRPELINGTYDLKAGAE